MKIVAIVLCILVAVGAAAIPFLDLPPAIRMNASAMTAFATVALALFTAIYIGMTANSLSTRKTKLTRCGSKRNSERCASCGLSWLRSRTTE